MHEKLCDNCLSKTGKLVRSALCEMPAPSHDSKEENKCKSESSASSPESKKRKLTDTEEQCETEDWECGIKIGEMLDIPVSIVVYSLACGYAERSDSTQ